MRADRLPPQVEQVAHVDKGRDVLVRCPDAGHAGEVREQRAGEAPQVGAARAPGRRLSAASVASRIDRMVAMAIAAIERHHDVGSHLLHDRRDRALDVTEAGPPPRIRAQPAPPFPSRATPAARLGSRRAALPRRASSASRMSPRFAGAASPAASPAISPSSPRVAQTTTDSTPRALACASTEPQPNVSSSGWATVRRSFTGPAGEGSRGRASLPKR